MARSRVLSFMSQWGAPPRSPTAEEASSDENRPSPRLQRKPVPIDTGSPQSSTQKLDLYSKAAPPASPTTPSRVRERADSKPARPSSMLHTYQPPLLDVSSDTIPELQPIFSYLNSHSNKLYQEGYFLKLHDLDSRGRPSNDRIWNECFAQLVGTVLSLWDAAALDAAGEDGEVVPTFINLSDASLKMIESLPMNGAQGGHLQNVLSISTAANNRYLLHFNSLNSLTQWTAGIRLAMFEHATLQEAYTGSLIAGKGKLLNNIRQIMERSKFVTEDWARVRFGAGTPWRRCWCVISPPDEKEYQKANKLQAKTLKKGIYDRAAYVPKGDIKFYDTRKVTKRTRPIATIKDAYAAYAIYPQSKPLIDQSTLVKLEGLVTVHSSMEQTSEGFVFVMPEVHPAVTGFEMMLRWLFPVFDTFALYGRPSKLIADTLDQRGLMFAMPRDRRYGYLDILDVSGLIHTTGSQAWSERQWRQEMKKLTSTRMSSDIPATASPRYSAQLARERRSTDSRPSGIKFQSDELSQSSPGSRSASPLPNSAGLQFQPPRRVDSAPPERVGTSPHRRAVSDMLGHRRFQTETPSRLSQEQSRPYEDDLPPQPPTHRSGLGRSHGPGSLDRIASEAEVPTISTTFADMHVQDTAPPEPVASPPAFLHSPSAAAPVNQRSQKPELRRAKSNLDEETMQQLEDATRRDRQQNEDYGNAYNPSTAPGYSGENSVITTNNPGAAYRNLGLTADRSQGLVNAAPNNKQYDPRRQQQPSPYDQSAVVGGTRERSFKDTASPAVPPQNRLPQYDATSDMPAASRQVVNGVNRPDMRSAGSSNSVLRKAVPQQAIVIPPQSDPYHTTGANEPDSPPSPAYDGGWEGALIDHDALERILNEETKPKYQPQLQQRTYTMRSFATDDTPDYASTASVSTPPEQEPKERPRAGKLKSVGDPDIPQHISEAEKFEASRIIPDSEMPVMDFGPTRVYKPTSRPGTGGALTLGGFGDFGEQDSSTPRDRSRKGSNDRLRDKSAERSIGSRPGTSRNGAGDAQSSYFATKTTPSPGGLSPLEQPGDRRIVAWQPVGDLATSPGPRQGLTPEQWVQQRASLAAIPQQAPPRSIIPVYAHQRRGSSESITQLRKSSQSPGPNIPPLSRTPSGDWTQQGLRISRPPSGDMMQQVAGTSPIERPRSRSSQMLLNPPSPGRVVSNGSANLTAREQMMISKATGTPLVNLGPKDQKKIQDEQAPGLVGALALREKEKAALKQGIRGGMVQQAIQARQQQQYQADLEAQQQAQLQAQQYWQQQMHMQAQQLQTHAYQTQMYQNALLGQSSPALNNHAQSIDPIPTLQTHNTGSYYGQYGNASPSAVAGAYSTTTPSVYQMNAATATPIVQSGGGYTNGYAQSLAASQQQPQPSPQQAYGASYFDGQQSQYGSQRR